MKKISAVAAIVFAANIMASAVFAQNRPAPNPSTDFKYDLTEDGNGVLIQEYVGKGKTVIVIPETIEGYPVTEIGEMAFMYANAGDSGERHWSDTQFKWMSIPKSIDYLYVPASVKKVDKCAFAYGGAMTNASGSAVKYCIKKLDIDLSKLDYIGEEAFFNCEFVKTDIVYKKAWANIIVDGYRYGETIKEEVHLQFENTNITSVEIEEGTDKITHSTFFGCKSLKSVSIPSSVKKIDYDAFGHCEALYEVKIPSGTKISYPKSDPDEFYGSNNAFFDCILNLASKKAVKDSGYTDKF